MNRGTTIMVAIALASAAGAWSMQSPPPAEARFEDEGQVLFPEFEDPLQAVALEVTSWDETAAKVVTFKVEQKNDVWVIPSHNDYPADATERMGEAAASFVGVKRDLVVSDDPALHGAFGLLDPQGTAGSGEEKGKRITLKDSTGRVLVDVLVGQAVPNKPGAFYVRFPDDGGGQRRPERVYESTIDLNITTRFGDWIEGDLLHVRSDEIARLEYLPYSVDEQAHRVIDRDPIIVELKDVDGTSSWVPLEGIRVPSGKAFDGQKVRQMANAIAGIQIVGVRPRPDRLDEADLLSRGFFVAEVPGGLQLLGNEGEAAVVTQDGLRYRLLFGELTYESGIALTAGASKSEESAQPKDSATASRYMWVDVTYDPTADQSLRANQDGVESTLGSPEDEGSISPPEDLEKQSKGEERAETLNRRFSEWYYVISDSSFKQVHQEPETLLKDIEN